MKLHARGYGGCAMADSIAPRVRRGTMLRALAVAAVVLLAGVGPLQASGPATLPSSIKLQQWETIPQGNWITGALQGNNADYMEGEAVPFRLVIPSKIDAGSYQFSVCRNYDDGARRGYLYIAPFNTDRPATPGGTIASTMDGFSAINATIDAVDDVGGPGGCKAGDRESIVTITKQDGDAYVLWGGHLASPLDDGVGPGNGAAAWPGASLHMKLSTPSKDLPITTCVHTPTPTAVLTVTSTGIARTTTVSPAAGTPSAVATDTPAPTATGTPQTTATETPEPSASAMPSASASATATAVATSTATPSSTASPAPTDTPPPGATSTPAIAKSATATLPPQTATVAAREAATATAVSLIAGESRLPRQVPNTGCPAGDSSTPWALVAVATLGGAAVATVGAGFAVKKLRP
jgi:hypothetical protein